jgi:hypothetical protein
MKAKGYFNVAGIYYPISESMKMLRIDWIAKYVVGGSRFELEREPDNEADPNAIKVVQVLASSGKRICIGYVPNSGTRRIADEFAPLVDNGWAPEIKFSMKYVDEATGECKGLRLTYPLR